MGAILDLSNEEMDKHCVTRKNDVYCENVRKKVWQERYISFNPEISFEELMKMHPYEMCCALKGGEKMKMEIGKRWTIMNWMSSRINRRLS